MSNTFAGKMPMRSQFSVRERICDVIPVMLAYRAVLVAPAGVGQVSSEGAFEETLASLACDLTVMLPAALVAAHHAHQVLALARALLVDAVPVT